MRTRSPLLRLACGLLALSLLTPAPAAHAQGGRIATWLIDRADRAALQQLSSRDEATQAQARELADNYFAGFVRMGLEALEHALTEDDGMRPRFARALEALALSVGEQEGKLQRLALPDPVIAALLRQRGLPDLLIPRFAAGYLPSQLRLHASGVLEAFALSGPRADSELNSDLIQLRRNLLKIRADQRLGSADQALLSSPVETLPEPGRGLFAARLQKLLAIKAELRHLVMTQDSLRPHRGWLLRHLLPQNHTQVRMRLRELLPNIAEYLLTGASQREAELLIASLSSPLVTANLLKFEPWFIEARSRITIQVLAHYFEAAPKPGIRPDGKARLKLRISSPEVRSSEGDLLLAAREFTIEESFPTRASSLDGILREPTIAQWLIRELEDHILRAEECAAPHRTVAPAAEEPATQLQPLGATSAGSE